MLCKYTTKTELAHVQVHHYPNNSKNESTAQKSSPLIGLEPVTMSSTLSDDNWLFRLTFFQLVQRPGKFAVLVGGLIQCSGHDSSWLVCEPSLSLSLSHRASLERALLSLIFVTT